MFSCLFGVLRGKNEQKLIFNGKIKRGFPDYFMQSHMKYPLVYFISSQSTCAFTMSYKILHQIIARFHIYGIFSISCSFLSSWNTTILKYLIQESLKLMIEYGYHFSCQPFPVRRQGDKKSGPLLFLYSHYWSSEYHSLRDIDSWSNKTQFRRASMDLGCCFKRHSSKLSSQQDSVRSSII